MGYSSIFETEEITIKDIDGLKAFLQHWEKTFGKGIADKMLHVHEGTYTFSFESWDDYKLISYWYDDTICFLTCVSKFIEGYARFLGEDNELSAIIHFQDNSFTLKLGSMTYENLSKKEFPMTEDKYKEFILPYMI